MIHTATSSAKFRRFARWLATQLGVSRVAAKVVAVGHLELLWHLAINSAKRGDIGCLEDIEIAEEIGWEGEPSELIEALVEFGWLNRHPEHRLVINDWHEHAPGFVKRNIVKVGGFVDCIRGCTKRELNDSKESLSGSLTTPKIPEAPTPNLTKPNLTKERAAEEPPASVSRLRKPSLEEVRAYCRERANRVDAEQFVDHYTANGWRQAGGTPIKDWKAAVRTWEKREFNRGTTGLPPPASSQQMLVPLRQKPPGTATP